MAGKSTIRNAWLVEKSLMFLLLSQALRASQNLSNNNISDTATKFSHTYQKEIKWV